MTVNLSGDYGFFRDEFYYIACSEHMAWGYVDHPPLSIALLWLSRLLFGDSLFAIRLLPAASGAVVVALAGLFTRQLGGGRYAQVLTAVSVMAAPLLLGMNGVYSMNSFDVLFWTLSFYLIVIILKNNTPKRWLLLGAVLGLGLLNKISVLWLGIGLTIGLLCSSSRRLFLTPHIWLAAAIALLLFLPHMIWQISHQFPTLEFIRNATGNKYTAASPWTLFSQQILNMNPTTFLIWISGVVYFLIAKPVRQFRVLPIIYLTVFLILCLNGNSKSEYLGPLFPMLFSMGAVAFEKFILKFNWHWLKPATIAVLLLSGIMLAPFAIAILPVETFISYSAALGMTPSTPENKELARLPQHYADRFGWPEMVATIAEAYHTLTPAEQAKCAIMANNYGEAGAIDFFGGQYGLPKAISGHNNYWLWGPRSADDSVVIHLGGSESGWNKDYTEAVLAGVFRNDYCMPYENNLSIWICRNRGTPLEEDWAEFKHYQ
jgi:4-amino-4-deoxy-L-arabinose transferase-like glycosyltransferase